MATKIFVNQPVEDLEASKAFFGKLGYSFNPQFSDDTAACMVISEDIYVMLLTHPKLKQFTKKSICDAKASTEGWICLLCDTRQQVDDIISKAVAAGGTAEPEPTDYGFMYQHGFDDLDGHHWEYVAMTGAPPQK